MSAQFFCQEPGCGKQVNGNRGIAAYCPGHRPTRTAASATGNGGGTLVDGLKAMQSLARRADRLEAKAKKLSKESTAAALAAGEARDELAEKLRELSA